MADLPPLNGLRAFDAAGRRLSFRAAADELGVTQGAVAQQVRRLEAHLNVTLFERVPTGLAFTPVGRSYHGRVAEVFAELQAATAELGVAPERVVISVTPTFAAKWLIPNLPQFSTVHPDVDLRILATEKISSFHSDGIDLAVRQGTPPFGAALNVVRLFEQILIPVAAPGMLGDACQALDPARLSGWPKIHDTHNHWPPYLAQFGLRDSATRALRLSQTTLAVDAAIAGQGVALVSEFLVAHDLDAGRLVRVGPPWKAGDDSFYLLAPRAAKRIGAVSAVTDWLTSFAEDQSVSP